MLIQVLIFFSLTISLNFSCTKDEDIFSQALDENIQEELEQSKEETETESSGEQNEENDFPGQEDESINAKDVEGELKAFPSCEGAGCYTTTGGRGGVVYHVTNLNNSGEGSLRNAFQVSGPVIIVFDVSGIINLTSSLTVTRGDFTIAGQTAPAGGITIDGHRVAFINVNNAIVRYIRFRGGVNASDDSFVAKERITNQVFDHCSFSFGGDESASWYATTNDLVDNLTIQRCIIAESASTGSIVGGLAGVSTVGDISIHHNLYYNLKHRFPNISGDNANFEVINNVSWSISNRLIRGNGSFNLNHIGNYNDYGRTPIKDTRLNMYAYSGSAPSIYTQDNLIIATSSMEPLTNSVAELNSNNSLSWKFFLDNGNISSGDQLFQDYFTSERHPMLGYPINIQSPEDAFNSVKSDVGCNKRLTAGGEVVSNLDELDSKWLDNVQSGIYEEKLSSNQFNVPSFIGGDSYLDSDRDGMPDIWEVSRGFNPNVDDSNADMEGDGYTNIEEFINLIDY